MQHNEGQSPTRWTIDIGCGHVLAREIIGVKACGDDPLTCSIIVNMNCYTGTRPYADVIADWLTYMEASQAEERHHCSYMYKGPQ